MRARAVVLGANGFLGAAVSRTLLRRGHDVVGFDREPPNPELVAIADRLRSGASNGPALEWVRGDFLDAGALRQALHGSQWVVHCITTTVPASAEARPEYDVETNLVGSIRLLEACQDCGVDKVLFASSGGTVYGSSGKDRFHETDPVAPGHSYAIVKMAIERYLESFHRNRGLGYSILRVANPYGPGQRHNAQGVVSVFMRRILHDRPIEVWGDGSAVRDYVYIDDVARAFVLAAESSRRASTYNVGSGHGLSIRMLIDRVFRAADRTVPVVFVPGRPVDAPRVVLDVDRIYRELGWRPTTSLSTGLADTWRSIVEENRAPDARDADQSGARRLPTASSAVNH